MKEVVLTVTKHSLDVMGDKIHIPCTLQKCMQKRQQPELIFFKVKVFIKYSIFLSLCFFGQLVVSRWQTYLVCQELSN